ncbi:hypothetical protein KGQ34_03970 [Patescibacteria group bacterium]|nr:hypothetical protein [Patescibacteria group bacterium]
MAKYSDLDLGTIEAVVNKLGGMDGVKRFLSGELAIKAAEHIFALWKTIKLGTGLVTADDFRRALKAGNFRIGDWGNDILGRRGFTAADEETEMDLVVLSVAELGFKDGAYRKDIYKRALKLGLELCPAEVGPQLRLQYKDQPMDEWLRIAMEPIITGSGGDLGVFIVGRGGGDLWLRGGGGHDRFWIVSNRWVFVRPRK